MKSYKQLDKPPVLDCLFHPRPEENSNESDNRYDIDVEVNVDVTLGCRLFLISPEAPTIILFHGNGETVSDYDDIARLYWNVGINLFVATYRGYGRSTGTPNVARMLRDSLYVVENFSKITSEFNLTGPIFIMGRSLGSAAAIEICHNSQEIIKGLIIESGFADTIFLLNQLGIDTSAQQTTESEGFGNIEKIAEIKLPTLILHGSADTIIPVAQAEKLQAFSGARAKKFFVIPGADHNGMITCGGEHYFSTIKGFMNEVTGENTWREKRRKHRKSGKI